MQIDDSKPYITVINYAIHISGILTQLKVGHCTTQNITIHIISKKINIITYIRIYLFSYILWS